MDLRATAPGDARARDAGGRAFMLADLARGRGAQGALAAAAARAGSSDSAISGLMRREQDLGGMINALNGYLLNQSLLPAGEQSPKIIAALQARVSGMRVERSRIRDEVYRKFPRYAELVNPRPATLEQARPSLREGEVLVSVLTTEERTYVWAVPRSGEPALHTANLGVRDVERIVAGLRRALDAGVEEIVRVPGFDLERAALLYATLLKLVEAAWQGARSLIVVTGGALARLPFSVLPTADIAPTTAGVLRFHHYRDIPWLVRSIAIAQLPAVSSLVTLRALPEGDPGRAMFAGFGDPEFGGRQVGTVAAPKLAMRNLGIERVTPQGIAAGTAPAGYRAYGALPPLPDTREEILAMASVLKADPQRDVFLGAAATRESVMKVNLGSRRIVAFATHGLIPGDFPGLDEPALALSAADGRAETGLLTLSDVLGLKLDADWVVLSACNTAAGDGAGAEAISGLGRGFFYAGSRALLVTHWPVETRSARQLVTTLFERYAADPKLSRAEALRQASLAVMEDYAKDASGKPLFSYAHPLFWAPYALVGDGGR
jgi:CHAT domain-containing protein